MSELLDFLRTHEEAFRSPNRLRSLYSDFRLQRASNPDGYEANSSAWLCGLKAASREGLLPLKQKSAASSQASRVAFTSGKELESALQTQQWGRPLALGAVVQDAVNKKELIPLNEFMTSTKSVYSKTWIPSPWQVVSWGLRQIGVGALLGGDDKLSVGNFVVMSNVEEAADAIIGQATSSTHSLTTRIYSRQLFDAEFAHVLGPNLDLSSSDINILLTFLSRDKPLLSYDATTIKFAAPDAARPEPITQQDRDIASLRTLITTLTAQVDALTTRITDLSTAARYAISQSRTHQAKNALRSKKLAESTLTTRAATLSQLEEVYTQIEQAADNIAIVRVMQSSSGVLNALHGEVGGTEGVESVVEKLREEMDNVEDVSRILNESSAGAVDDSAVDEELEALEFAEKERKDAEEAKRTAEKLAELDRLDAERRARQSAAAAVPASKERDGDRVMADAQES